LHELSTRRQFDTDYRDQLSVSLETYRSADGPVPRASSTVFRKGAPIKMTVRLDGGQMPRADSRSLQ